MTGYKIGKKILKEFPLYLSEIVDVTSEEIPGWGNTNYGVKDKKKISKELSSYLKYIKNKLSDLNAKIISVGTGPDREHFFEWEK